MCAGNAGEAFAETDHQGCLFHCRKMNVKQKDAKSVEKFKTKLADHAKKIGGVFVHYDVDSATWLMKVDHF